MNTINFCSSLILFIYHLLLSQSFTIGGNQYTDLEWNDAQFASEVSQWTNTFTTRSSAYSQCSGFYIMGGYGISNPMNYMSRTYSGLPIHSMIILTIDVWRIDSWDPPDGFTITIDSTDYSFHDMSYTRANNNLCGASSFDPGPLTVSIKQFHTSSTITIKITNKCDQDSTDESLGIRNVAIIFKSSSGDSQQVYQNGEVYALDPPSETITSNCTAGFFESESDCMACDTSCAACSGFNGYDCLSCSSSYDPSRSLCLPCASGCRSCSSNSAYSCTSCIEGFYLFADGSCRENCGGTASSSSQPWTCSCSNYIYPNGSCLTSCSSPYLLTINGGQKYCDTPCSSGEYLYQNGSCETNCPSPFVIESGNLCNFPCQSSEYFYPNNSCLGHCSSPWILYMSNGNSYCLCGSDYYYYQNGSCLIRCDSPDVISTMGLMTYCQTSSNTSTSSTSSSYSNSSNSTDSSNSPNTTYAANSSSSSNTTLQTNTTNNDNSTQNTSNSNSNSGSNQTDTNSSSLNSTNLDAVPKLDTSDSSSSITAIVVSIIAAVVLVTIGIFIFKYIRKNRSTILKKSLSLEPEKQASDAKYGPPVEDLFKNPTPEVQIEILNEIPQGYQNIVDQPDANINNVPHVNGEEYREAESADNLMSASFRAPPVQFVFDNPETYRPENEYVKLINNSEIKEQKQDDPDQERGSKEKAKVQNEQQENDNNELADNKPEIKADEEEAKKKGEDRDTGSLSDESGEFVPQRLDLPEEDNQNEEKSF